MPCVSMGLGVPLSESKSGALPFAKSAPGARLLFSVCSPLAHKVTSTVSAIKTRQSILRGSRFGPTSCLRCWYLFYWRYDITEQGAPVFVFVFAVGGFANSSKRTTVNETMVETETRRFCCGIYVGESSHSVGLLSWCEMDFVHPLYGRPNKESSNDDRLASIKQRWQHREQMLSDPKNNNGLPKMAGYMRCFAPAAYFIRQPLIFPPCILKNQGLKSKSKPPRKESSTNPNHQSTTPIGGKLIIGEFGSVVWWCSNLHPETNEGLPDKLNS